MPIDLRIVFLVLAAASGLLLLLSGNAPPLTLGRIGQIFIHFLLVPTVVLTVVIFAFLLTRTDPFPLIREGAYLLGLQQLVSFEHAIPGNLADNISVRSILREDTDGDGFDEWVVFYKFDTREFSSPIQAIIYDNDRGNPPVIFAYALRPPARDYVAEDTLLPPTFVLEPITADQNGPDDTDLPEIVIHGPHELSIFRFRENSEPWDFPRDAPPRYESIGFFRGSGGVTIDLVDNIGDVSVVDRNGFERSQLAIRSTFQVNPTTNSYWDQFYGPTELDRKLAPPVFSTIDFFGGPPDDIFDSAFPEKVVLGFYVANCAAENETLCVNAAMTEWEPGEFLAGDALTEFQNNNSGYFGLPNFGGIQDLAVVHLHYYPSLETDPDLLQQGGGRDVVTREEGQFDVVDVTFVADGAPLQTFRYRMELVQGRWKITGRSTVPLSSIGSLNQSGGPEDNGSAIVPVATPTMGPCENNILPVAVTNGSITAMFGKGQAPATFDGSGSSDPDGTIVNYQWDFGDGSPPQAGQMAIHNYDGVGNYLATLTVQDNCGATSQAPVNVTITDPIPPPQN